MTGSKIYDPRVHEILQKLTELSKEMNQAVQAKDLRRIEAVHSKKSSLIDELNSLIISIKGWEK